MTKLALFRDDELYLVLRGGTYCVHGTIDGRRIRKGCKTNDLARAKIFLENLKRELTGGWRDDYDRADRDWKTVADLVCNRHKFKSRTRGIPFELKAADVYGLMKSTGFRCAISGVPFAKRFAQKGEVDPWAPSIDRIENRHGYSLDNVRIVCLAANIAMNSWGHDVLLRLARGVVRISIRVDEELTHQLISADVSNHQVIDFKK